MDMAIPVTLIVKAPNQQFEDQTIQCELTWTIKRLKGYLSEVYPCKPSTDEQKLIYSGQLLSDSVVLKDVLRQYEGQETHTVHLVYTPKNRNFGSTSMSNKKPETKSTPTSSQSSSGNANTPTLSTNSNDGLRQRNVSSPTPVNSTPSQPPPPFMGGFYQQPPNMISGTFIPPMAQQTSTLSGQQQMTPQQYFLAQQMTIQNMMQQMYMQYYNHYATQTGSQPPYPSMPYFSQNIPGMYTPNVSQASATTSTYQNVSDQLQPDAALTATATPAPAAGAATANPLYRRPPVQLEDDNENRDWLEIFYTFSRLIVLLSLVYFYSSPIRCSIVMFVATLYYFYTNQRNSRERRRRVAAELIQRIAQNMAEEEGRGNNNNNNNNAENSSQQNGENESNTETNGETATSSTPENAPNGSNDSESVSTATTPDSSDGGDISTTSSADSTEQDDNNRLPSKALLRTFVLSFFASLIPETPAV